MEPVEFFDPITLSQVTDPAEPWMTLDFAAVYQDTLTRDWGLQACDRTTQLVRTTGVRSTWWRMDFLSHPQVFDAAVRTASQADVICVSVYAASSVPSQLARWCEEWLARRCQKEGALIALVGAAPPSGPPLAATLEYLRHAAETGGLDFLSDEKLLPGQPAVFSGERIALPAYALPQNPQIFFQPDSASYRHFGINE